MKSLALLLLLSVCFAATLTMELRDFTTNNPITNSNVLIEMHEDDGESRSVNQFVGPDGIARILLEDGAWHIKLKMDDLTTGGKDYYAEQRLHIQSDREATVFFRPVGSVRGSVVDEQGNVLPGARIKFDCIGDYGETSEQSTDEYGSFRADWLPIGSCRVSALYEDMTGSQGIEVSAGMVTETQVVMQQRVANPILEHPLRFLALFVVVTVLLLIVIAFLYIRAKKMDKRVKDLSIERAELRDEAARIEKKKRPVIRVEKKASVDELIQTLPEREQGIIRLVLENKGELTQAQIFKLTRIPKTSLSRAIKSLERHNFVEIEEFGKVKKVRLAEWFKEKL
ncbi:MAG: hypothetical protein JW834_04955 [Candidatus Diapherotrites archaeon]|nr:hypothetical protein [Candidatus Diapherotrites archaeon]